jgi:PKD domain
MRSATRVIRLLLASILSLLALVILDIPNALASDDQCPSCHVGPGRGDSYLGALILPPGSDEGLAQEAAHCDGCEWNVVPACRDTAGTGDSNCIGAARLCAPAAIRMDLFLKRNTWPTFRKVGEFCEGPGDLLTPEALIPGVRDQFVRYLPALRPSFEPRTRGIVNLPVVFAAGEPASLGRRAFKLGAYQVDLEATATWHWDFGDGHAGDFASPGGPYPDTDVTHTYLRQQTCAVTVTTTWAGQFWVDGAGPFEVTGPPLTQAQTLVVPVKEARAVLVS